MDVFGLAPFLAGLAVVVGAGVVRLAIAAPTRRERMGTSGARARSARAGSARASSARVSAPLAPPPAAGAKRSPARMTFEEAATSEFAAATAIAARRAGGAGKRSLDVAAAILLLVFFAPLLALVAVLIKLDSPGPVFYRQVRVGKNGLAFEILKFRSMHIDAEKNGACWATHNDCRITRVGRVIRKMRIDEMPQAINVLRGEMSFVGPRPERPEFVRELELCVPFYHVRHMVRPGITGWAQVNFTYGASVDDARIKHQFDLHYIRNFSLWRDLRIMMLTVRVALFGLGSR